MPPSTNGCGSGAPDERLTRFIAALPKQTPKFYDGQSTGTKCDVCAADIPPGTTEFEVQFSAVVFRLDRTCFARWLDRKR